MKPISELNLGFADAENYQTKDNRELFSRIFVKNSFLDQIYDSNKFFLIGEKGTGKTAYSVYLSTNAQRDTCSELRYLRETEYEKFVKIKQKEEFGLSEFTGIWKVILLILIAKSIRSDDLDHNAFTKKGKLSAILEAIDDYYNHAFAPEIINVLNFVEDSKVAAELISKYLRLKGETGKKTEFSQSKYQINLLYIERSLMDALSGIKLKWNHFLFIDGIDIRPSGIPYSVYLECVKGLTNAAWSLNQDFFSRIKDSKGRMKVVALIRPDIFNSLGLQNSTNKIADNSVFLDWRTTYPRHRQSELFTLASKILAVQQDQTTGNTLCWDSYFDWGATDEKDISINSAFCDFLRVSYSRPRDLVKILKIYQDIQEQTSPGLTYFSADIFKSDQFKRAYSEYLMGGVRDQLSFYYTESDYEIFLKFFQFLNGRIEFSYKEYLQAFENYEGFVKKRAQKPPVFTENPNTFLQFLYDTNILCWVEYVNMKPHFSFCYRDRSISNISPKVKEGVTYRIHEGLHKALRVGHGAVTSGRREITPI